MFAGLKLRAVLAIALVGSGAGVHLGRSAIAEINPVHFRGDEGAADFYADLAPQAAGAAAWDGISTAPPPVPLGSSCIGCRTYPEEYYPVQDPAVEAYDEITVTTAEPPVHLASYPPELSPEEARIRADLERVALYASAPVTAEEQASDAAEAETPLTQLTSAY